MMDWCYFGAGCGVVGLVIACISYGHTTARQSEYYSMKKALMVACSIIKRSKTGMSKAEYDQLKTALGGDYPTIKIDHFDEF